MAKVNYGKIAEKILALLEDVPKDSAGHILNFVAQCRGVESFLVPTQQEFDAVRHIEGD